MSAWHLFSRKTKNTEGKWNIRTMFGPNLNFAATEAYKLLRTNLVYSFADTSEGKVIGVTSADIGEGKSSTACNIAYAMEQAGGKVLLLEADLRRPTLASKLGIARRPGVVNMLVNKEHNSDVVQQSAAAPNMDVITSGDIPPNPSELLGSERMAQVMGQMKKEYDYIIVDLPPVTLVSDAVAMAKILDGVVVVVRGDHAEKKLLAETMRQLNMVGVRILGFVYRISEEASRDYTDKYKKKNYV